MDSSIFFHGGFLNAVDAKGRVSLPASFRKVIEKRSRQTFPNGDEDKAVFVGAMAKKGCLRAFDQSYSKKIYASIEAQIDKQELDPVERLEAISEATLPVFGTSQEVSFDSAGRMVLSPLLREAAGITDLAWFMGNADTFQIWSPERFRESCADQAGLLAALDFELKDRAR